MEQSVVNVQMVMVLMEAINVYNAPLHLVLIVMETHLMTHVLNALQHIV